MAPHIRLFETRDRTAVIGLWVACGIGRPGQDLDGEIERLLHHDASLFLVATEGDSVVGAVMGSEDGRRGWVYHLAVDLAHRHRGIGRLLMTDLERLMRARGVAKMNLKVQDDNLEVVAFYERLGFADDHVVSLGKWLGHAGTAGKSNPDSSRV